MPLMQLAASQEEKHKSIIRTPLSLRDEIMKIAIRHGMTYNATLNMLLRQAVDAQALAMASTSKDS